MRKVIFADDEHKFVGGEHVFKGGEHKFAKRKHKICRIEKKKRGADSSSAPLSFMLLSYFTSSKSASWMFSSFGASC